MLKIILKYNKLFIIISMFEKFIDKGNSTSRENSKDKIISEEGNVLYE